MNVYEYECDEQELRERLDAELGVITAGAAPMEAVIGAGRTMKRRRRQAWGGALGAVAAVTAASLLSTSVLHGTQPTKPTPLNKHSITVNSSAHDTAKGLIGSGTIDGITWADSISTSTGNAEYMQSIGGAPSSTAGRLVDDGSEPTASAPLRDLDGESGSVVGPSGESVYFTYGSVPSDIASLVVDFADGESDVVPAVTVGAHRYVVFAGTANVPLLRLTAYNDVGAQLGYSIPFNNKALPIIESWYQPGEIPSLKQSTTTISGNAGSVHWELKLDVGPFGVCETYTVPPLITGTTGCTPPVIPSTDSLSPGTASGTPMVIAGELNPAVARVVAVLADGTSVQLPLRHLDGMVFSGYVFPVGTQLRSLTSYDGAGKVLASEQNLS